MQEEVLKSENGRVHGCFLSVLTLQHEEVYLGLDVRMVCSRLCWRVCFYIAAGAKNNGQGAWR